MPPPPPGSPPLSCGRGARRALGVGPLFPREPPTPAPAQRDHGPRPACCPLPPPTPSLLPPPSCPPSPAPCLLPPTPLGVAWPIQARGAKRGAGEGPQTQPRAWGSRPGTAQPLASCLGSSGFAFREIMLLPSFPPPSFLSPSFLSPWSTRNGPSAAATAAAARPSVRPTVRPTVRPSVRPTVRPTAPPSLPPSVRPSRPMGVRWLLQLLLWVPGPCLLVRVRGLTPWSEEPPPLRPTPAYRDIMDNFQKPNLSFPLPPGNPNHTGDNFQKPNLSFPLPPGNPNHTEEILQKPNLSFPLPPGNPNHTGDILQKLNRSFPLPPGNPNHTGSPSPWLDPPPPPPRPSGYPYGRGARAAKITKIASAVAVILGALSGIARYMRRKKERNAFGPSEPERV